MSTMQQTTFSVLTQVLANHSLEEMISSSCNCYTCISWASCKSDQWTVNQSSRSGLLSRCMRQCARGFFFTYVTTAVRQSLYQGLSNRSQTDHEGSFVALLLADNAEIRKLPLFLKPLPSRFYSLLSIILSSEQSQIFKVRAKKVLT